jgi:excisionase family DNA binding protein
MKENELKESVLIPDCEFYTIEQAAKKMGLGEITLQRAIENKELKAFIQNRNKFIFHSDLVAYIRLGGDALENKAKSNLPKKK